MSAHIEQLARLRGIGDAYYDYRGELRYFTLESKTEILRAMGCAVDDEQALAAEVRRLNFARTRALAPAVAICRGPRIGMDLNISARDFGATLTWRIRCEDGSQHEAAVSTTDLPELWRGEVEGAWVTRRRFELPIALNEGYHQLEIKLGGTAPQRTSVIAGHGQCFKPPALSDGGKLWGVAVQLYSVRSRRNWGMGDFDDLQALIRWLGPRGAGFIGLNPLHALEPAEPGRASPYSASSRHLLNILYIAIESVPEFAACAPAQELMRSFDFAGQLQTLRAADAVDYAGVARVKLAMLRILYSYFVGSELAYNTVRARGFKAFVAAGGELLRQQALFDALDAHLANVHRSFPGWQNWPAEFRDPQSRAVSEFAGDHPQEIEFYLYAQWLAHDQLIRAQALAREVGMPIGLYGDFAVGAHPSGAEVWSDQQLYRLRAEIGAPPDPLALKGQGWGLPPQDPHTLESQGLLPFTRLLQNNMRYYGALRLDHVMALFRQWWVPAGFSSAQGAYVHYPLHPLLATLTVQSHRHQCLVVGEDLGVVPDEIRAAMPDYGLLHYKVLLFEKQDGRFKTPEEYEPQALATATTHDMPSLRSYWEAHDIHLRDRLDLYPDAQVRDQLLAEREQDLAVLMAALEHAGLTPKLTHQPNDAYTLSVADSVHEYLARSASMLASVQIEDLLGMLEPVNVPGTHMEYPNWQRKLTQDLEDIEARTDLGPVFDALNRARRGGVA